MRSLARLAFALLVACGGRGHTTAASSAASLVAPANETEPRLVAIDVYGSSHAINERIVAEHGDELRRFGKALVRHDRAYDRNAAIVLVGAEGDFVSIEPALVGYYEDEGMESYPPSTEENSVSEQRNTGTPIRRVNSKPRCSSAFHRAWSPARLVQREDVETLNARRLRINVCDEDEHEA